MGWGGGSSTWRPQCHAALACTACVVSDGKPSTVMHQQQHQTQPRRASRSAAAWSGSRADMGTAWLTIANHTGPTHSDSRWLAPVCAKSTAPMSTTQPATRLRMPLKHAQPAVWCSRTFLGMSWSTLCAIRPRTQQQPRPELCTAAANTAAGHTPATARPQQHALAGPHSTMQAGCSCHAQADGAAGSGGSCNTRTVWCWLQPQASLPPALSARTHTAAANPQMDRLAQLTGTGQQTLHATTVGGA